MDGSEVRQCVLGIDGGGTHTRGLIIDDQANILGQGESGPSNPFYNTDAQLEAVLAQAIELAVAEHAGPPIRIEAVAAGIAGAIEGRKQPAITEMLHRIVHTLPKRCGNDRVATPPKNLPVLVESDFVISLAAGTGRREGIVIISGTGSSMYGETADGRWARAGGWGPYLDDEGSGNEIGHMALRAVVQANDGRGPQTLLSQKILQAWGKETPRALFRYVLDTAPAPAEVATLAQIVEEAAENGDAVAAEILRHAGQRLAAGVLAVARQIKLQPDEPVPIVLSGGVLTHIQTVRQELQCSVKTAYPAAHFIVQTRSPAMGAAYLAAHQLGWELVKA